MKLHIGRQDDSANTLLRDDPKFASQKIAFFQYSAIAVFLFLITGFWDLQIRNPEMYQERALENSVKSIPVLAPRGKILDRDGRVIVDNHSSFSLYLSRENLKTEHLRPIAEGLNLDYDSLVARVHRFQSRGAPDQSVASFNCSCSFVTPPKIIAPSRPLPMGSACIQPGAGPTVTPLMSAAA